MTVLGVILARAGSKGLPGKCLRRLRGKAVIEYTIEHARRARRLDHVVLTTDSPEMKAIARAYGVAVIDRSPVGNRCHTLASDTARVDETVRHAVSGFEPASGRDVDAVVILYGNIPVRDDGVIDRAVVHLLNSRADSVRTVSPVGKHHPDWMFRLDGDRIVQYRTNSIHRRQELEPLYYHDGAVVAVTRSSLFAPEACGDDPHAFFGRDRRGLAQSGEATVDIDVAADLYHAEAVLREQSQDRLRTVSIGNRLVGPGQSVYIVAEAGVNHNGKLDRALELVDIALSAGADAVKFQCFTTGELVTETTPTARYQQCSGAATQRELLSRLELTLGDFQVIQDHCRKRSIDFLATPFSVTDLQQLLRLNPPAVKLASTDLNHPILQEAAARCGRTLIVSTGTARLGEIHQAVQRLRSWGAEDRTVLLHCVSRYPTPRSMANLRAMETLQRETLMPTGFSDHTVSPETGALAVAAGACLLEKHFTFDRRAPGPDHAMSLEPGGLREYVRRARDAEEALGNGNLDERKGEEEVRTLARRSVVATRRIDAGQVLSADMMTAKRPSGGITPGEISALIGRRVCVPIEVDQPLSWEMVR